MNKTSLTHPLLIAAVSAGSQFGRIGITFSSKFAVSAAPQSELSI